MLRDCLRVLDGVGVWYVPAVKPNKDSFTDLTLWRLEAHRTPMVAQIDEGLSLLSKLCSSNSMRNEVGRI